MLPGILSLLISSSDLSGNIKTDALVLEVDERYTKKVFTLTKPEYVVITNICRDQPPRHRHVDLVFEKIKEEYEIEVKTLYCFKESLKNFEVF